MLVEAEEVVHLEPAEAREGDAVGFDALRGEDVALQRVLIGRLEGFRLGRGVAELAAVVAFSAIKNNDRVGLIIFTDRVETSLKPSAVSRKFRPRSRAR